MSLTLSVFDSSQITDNVANNLNTISQVFTTNSSWVCPTTGPVIVELFGAGGAGGGSSSSSFNGGAGGAGGSYISILFLAGSLNVGTSYTVVVGSGGTSVAGGNGNNAGPTWFSVQSWYNAGISTGGQASTSSTLPNGGTAGTPTNFTSGSLSITLTTNSGGSGGAPITAENAGAGGGGNADSFGIGKTGQSGSGITGGNGGYAGNGNNSGGSGGYYNTTNPNNGSSYLSTLGGGGGGGGAYNNPTALPGANGGAGAVRITWFDPAVTIIGDSSVISDSVSITLSSTNPQPIVSESSAITDTITPTILSYVSIAESSAIGEFVQLEITSYINVAESTAITSVLYNESGNAQLDIPLTITPAESSACTDVPTLNIPVLISGVVDSTLCTDIPDIFNQAIRPGNNVYYATNSVSTTVSSLYGFNVAGGLGSIVIVVGYWQDDAASVSSESVSDSLGNLYTKTFSTNVTYATGGHNYYWNIWYAVNVSGWAANNNTITLTLSSAPNASAGTPAVALDISDFSNFQYTPALDQAANQALAANGPTITPTAINELLFSVASASGTGAVPNGAWTELNQSTTVSTGYEIAGAITSHQGTWATPTNLFASAVISFKNLIPTAFDISAITDSTTINIPVLISGIFDSSAVVDSPSVAINSFNQVNVSESSAITDIPTLQESAMLLSVADSTTCSDVPVIEEIYLISVNESSAVHEFVNTNFPLTFSIFDSSAITDMYGASNLNISVSDSTQVFDGSPVGLITLISHTAFGYTASPTTSSAINTIGATLIVVAIADVYNDAFTITDSQSNTWTKIQSYNNAPGIYETATLLYCVNPSTNASHTFSYTGYGAGVCVAAFSAASVLDQQTGNAVGYPATSIQPGSIVPSQNNELIVTMVGSDFNSPNATIGGYTITDNLALTATGPNYFCCLAYQVQTEVTPANPTWSLLYTGNYASAIASFEFGTASYVPILEIIQEFSINDSTVVSDSVSVLPSGYTSIESSAISDIPNLSMLSNIFIAETESVSDLVSIQIPLTISVADSSACTDVLYNESGNPQVDIPLPPNVADSSAISESISLFIPTLTINLFESSAVSENILTTGLMTLSVAESSAVSENLVIGYSVQLSVADSTTCSDVFSVNLPLPIFVSDQTPTTDVWSNSLIPISLSVAESSACTDIPTLEGYFFISVVESSSISDAVSNSLMSNVIVSDSSALAEFVSLNISVQFSTSDSSTTTDAIFINQVLDISVNESSTIGESVQANFVLPISVLDSSTITDTIIVNYGLPANTNDSTAVSENLTMEITYNAVGTDSTTTTDVIASIQTYSNTSVADSSTTSDVPTIAIATLINVADSSAIGESVSINESAMLISVSESTAIGELIALNESAIPVSISDSSAISDAIFVNLPLPVSAVESSSIADVPVIRFNLSLSVNDSTIVSDSAQPVFFEYVISQEITPVSDAIALSIYSGVLYLSVSESSQIGEHVQILITGTPARGTLSDELVNSGTVSVKPVANPPVGFDY